jgi:HlyD family secretion protein
MHWPLRRWLWMAFLLALTGPLAYAFVPAPVPVDLGRVTRGPMQATDEEVKTRIKVQCVISALLVGRLLRIQLKAGDHATANQTLLAVIGPRQFPPLAA